MKKRKPDLAHELTDQELAAQEKRIDEKGGIIHVV